MSRAIFNILTLPIFSIDLIFNNETTIFHKIILKSILIIFVFMKKVKFDIKFYFILISNFFFKNTQIKHKTELISFETQNIFNWYTYLSTFVDILFRFGIWCLTPLSTIFQS